MTALNLNNQPEQDHQLILDFLEKTNQPIFLTGKAGTGKTTLLKKIKEKTKKNFAVVAPTAVAAINAGGVTIHSFFQMPFGPIIPLAKEQPFKTLKYNDEKTKLLKCLELLIIDEISMVRADMLDFIDHSLKQVKGSSLPFGGVQVLMIGDLYQLSPIAHDAWHILKAYYLSPYFFDSQILKSVSLVTFELKKVYRQSDPLFLDILNRMRENTLTPELLEHLNTHFDPSLNEVWKDEYITLTTHNKLVTQINQECLTKLDGEIYSFTAQVTGDFPKDAYPVDEVLQLKVGAQIMFIKNDSSNKKLYYNGKAAKVTAISKDRITVQFLDENSHIEVEREEWQNLKYNLDQQENKIEEVNTGSFSQYPFKLAWAITIHKSQGLTFEKAIVDISSSFTHGQAYVALSRCKSLAGLILKSPVKMENIITDKRIIGFTEKAVKEAPTAQGLENFVKTYTWSLIDDLFDFNALQENWNSILTAKFRAFDEQSAFTAMLANCSPVLDTELTKVASRFKNQEIAKTDKEKALINDPAFIERLKKASVYFIPKINQLITEISRFTNLKLLADENAEQVLNTLIFCLNTLNIKQALFDFDWNHFSIQQYTKTVMAAGNKFELNPKKKEVKTEFPKEIVNQKLYQSLVEWRRKLSEQKNVAEHTILSDVALLSIASKPPKSTDQLAAIRGVGIGNAIELGGDIMKIVNGYMGASTLF